MVDLKKLEEAARLIIEAVGDDPTREGLVETPRACAMMLSGDRQPGDALGQQVLTDLARGLRFRDPISTQPGSLDGSSRLGTTRDQPSPGECSQ